MVVSPNGGLLYDDDDDEDVQECCRFVAHQTLGGPLPLEYLCVCVCM